MFNETRTYCSQCGRTCEVIWIDRYGGRYPADIASVNPDAYYRASDCCEADTVTDLDIDDSRSAPGWPDGETDYGGHSWPNVLPRSPFLP